MIIITPYASCYQADENANNKMIVSVFVLIAYTTYVSCFGDKLPDKNGQYCFTREVNEGHADKG